MYSNKKNWRMKTCNLLFLAFLTSCIQTVVKDLNALVKAEHRIKECVSWTILNTPVLEPLVVNSD